MVQQALQERGILLDDPPIRDLLIGAGVHKSPLATTGLEDGQPAMESSWP